MHDHHLKADILEEAFKDRLGISEPCSLDLEVFQLIQQHPNLSPLEEPFSHDKIDLVIHSLHSDKSPEPDGFNTDFVNRCWPIIKEDFYHLCDAFHAGSLCLQSINGFVDAKIWQVQSINGRQQGHLSR